MEPTEKELREAKADRLIDTAKAMLPRLSEIATDAGLNGYEFVQVMATCLGAYCAALAVEQAFDAEKVEQLKHHTKHVFDVALNAGIVGALEKR